MTMEEIDKELTFDPKVVEEVLLQMEQEEMGSFFLMAQEANRKKNQPFEAISPPFGPGHKCSDYNWLDGYCGCHLMEPPSEHMLRAIEISCRSTPTEVIPLTEEEIDALLGETKKIMDKKQ